MNASRENYHAFERELQTAAQLAAMAATWYEQAKQLDLKACEQLRMPQKDNSLAQAADYQERKKRNRMRTYRALSHANRFAEKYGTDRILDSDDLYAIALVRYVNEIEEKKEGLVQNYRALAHLLSQKIASFDPQGSDESEILVAFAE